jgi:hypothetical protein
MVNSTFMGAPEGFPRIFRPCAQKPWNVFLNIERYISVFQHIIAYDGRIPLFKYHSELCYLD